MSIQRQTGLKADVSHDHDADGDGLVDAQELVLGTSPSHADSDNDGYSDLEELARKTSPVAAQFHPENEVDNSLGLGMSCYWSSGKIHALIALYMPDRSLSNKTFRVGMMLGNRIVSIPESELLRRAQVETYPARDPAARIVVVDFPFSPSIVHRFHSVTVFATSGYTSTGVVATADAAHLIDVNGVVVFCKVDHAPVAYWSNTTNGQQHPNSAGLLYIPFGDGDDGPINWTPGAVCQQQTQVVGTSGATVTEEVVSAECTDGWDSSCPPGCADSVGSTSTTVDPVLLIGG